MKKVFVIGLPRTGTTSVCVALLELGYRVAHSANTMRSIEVADAVGDTPAYCDYKKLDRKYPGSKFIYLDRRLEKWLPSIKHLLTKMQPGLGAKSGGFHSTVKRCYRAVFKDLTEISAMSDAELAACYEAHRRAVYNYFGRRANDFLRIDISEEGSYQSMLEFLAKPASGTSFPLLNANGRIVSWHLLDHPNKVPEDL